MPDDGCRYELVEGKLIRMAPAGGERGDLAMSLSWPLAAHVSKNRLGKVYAAETGFILASNPDTMLAPDAAYVNRARVEELGVVRSYMPCAPDLVVEVISPNGAYAQIDRKVQCWIEAGCRAVVVVAPRRRTVTVCRPDKDPVVLTEEDTLEIDDVVPGWSFPLRELFA